MSSEPSRRRIPGNKVDPLFVDRWSPRSFLSEPLAQEDVRALFEAARWAPSSRNEQPWVFLVATSQADLRTFCSLLKPANQTWARRAPLLTFLISRRFHSDTRRPNRTALFDCGAAWMSLAVQARMLGFYAHAMAGIDRDRAYRELGIDRERYQIVVAIAVGRRGPPEALEAENRQQEFPSDRMELDAFTHFAGEPGGAPGLLRSSRQALWTHEYEVRQGINLNYIHDDRPPVVDLVQDLLSKQGRTPATVLDLGCGKGRVGMHLVTCGHRVIGLDFVPTALEAFAGDAAKAGVADRLTTHQQNLLEPWQAANGSVDAVLAITVLNNFINPDLVTHLRSEALRVLKPNGLLVVETYMPEDEYYGHLVRAVGRSGEAVVNDPINGLSFRAFSDEEVRNGFSENFALIAHQVVRRNRIKYGQPCQRVSRIYVFAVDNGA